jgi:hypothetical protein
LYLKDLVSNGPVRNTLKESMKRCAMKRYELSDLMITHFIFLFTTVRLKFIRIMTVESVYV